MAATKAKRGDLVVVEKRTSYVTTSKGHHEVTIYEVGIVTSITRDGITKAIQTHYGDSTPLANIFGVGRTFIVPQDEIDVQAAARAAWANEWKPGYPGKPFDSLDEVRKTVAPFKLSKAA